MGTFKIRKGEEKEYDERSVNQCFLSTTLSEQTGDEHSHTTHSFFQFQEEYNTETHQRTLYLTECDQTTPNSIIFSHSAHCPFLHLSSSQNVKNEEIDALLTRGIDIASCLVIERFNSITGQKEVLLTKRHPQMRQFPNIWVVPGGHVDNNETLIDSAVRELHEEVGIDLSHILSDDIGKERIKFIGGWESVFPSQITFGYPRRHHFVAYFLISLTEEEGNSLLKLSPDEVEIAAWINYRLAYSLVSILYPYTLLPKFIDDQLLEVSEFEGIFIGDKENVHKMLKVKDHLTGVDCSLGKERISTSTLFILSQWLFISDSPHSSL